MERKNSIMFHESNASGTFEDKKNRVLAVYADMQRRSEDSSLNNANIVQVCKCASVSRNFFYDTFKTLKNVPNIALEDLKEKTENLAARISMQTPIGAIRSILDAVIENHDISYIVTSACDTCEQYREFLTNLVRELVCERTWETPLREYEYMTTMKGLFLTYKIKEIAAVEDLSEFDVQSEAERLTLVMRAICSVNY